MKKLLIAIGLAIGLTASAQEFVSQDVLAVSAVYATNTMQITNLLVASGGSNVTGVAFTNLGTRVVVSGTTGVYTPLLKDVELWPDRNGRWYSMTTNSGTGTLLGTDSPFNMSVTMAGGSGANSGVAFYFAPVYDGDNMSTTERFIWGAVATTSTTITTSTNVPVWLWPGAKKLRCIAVVNLDTDATSHVIVRALKLNSFRP